MKPEQDPKWCGLHDDPNFVQCCCNCVYHRPVHFHCGHEPLPDPKLHEGKCACNVQKGWACASPEMDVVYDNWPEHSCGCECHTTQEEAEKGAARLRQAQDLLFYTEHPNAPRFCKGAPPETTPTG